MPILHTGIIAHIAHLTHAYHLATPLDGAGIIEDLIFRIGRALTHLAGVDRAQSYLLQPQHHFLHIIESHQYQLQQ